MPFRELTTEEKEKWEREIRQMRCMSPEHRPTHADVAEIPTLLKRVWVCPDCGHEAEYMGRCPGPQE
jgi:rubrerythrin